MRTKLSDLLAFWEDEAGWPPGWSFEEPNEEFLALVADPKGATTEVIGVEWALGPLTCWDGCGTPERATFYGSEVRDPDSAKVFEAWAKRQNRTRAVSGSRLVETLCN